MRLSPFPSDALHRAAARAGTAIWLIAGIVLLTATLRGQWAARARPIPAAQALAAPAKPETARHIYRPGESIEPGDEIVLVFIGASFCNAHNRAGFAAKVEAAKLRLQEQAKAGGLRFRAIGVALDWRTADGLAFLARFGEFDEVSSGSNWISDGATKYIWRDIPGDADVPQMLVLRRTIQTGRAIQLGDDHVVKRIRGAGEIEAWVASGAKL